MSRSRLPAIARLDDLPALVAALGHRPCWEPLPEVGLAPNGAGTRLARVGAAGEVDWIGVECAEAERTARAVAMRLRRRGRLGLVLALDPAARRLAVAAAFGDAPALRVDLDAPDGAQLAGLARLGADERTVPGAGWLARAADVLGSEPVGARFFRRFRTVLERMVEALPPAAPAEDRRALALLQLTRVLFLYFVQSKGWLAGRRDFLAREVDRCLAARRRLHRHLLRPLFFGTLNRPPGERSAACRSGAVPYLNGGLFEPHPLERRWRADLPNDVWREAFDELFERFRFTAAEGDGPDAVAPDMLGRVFEGLMAPERRRESGTFYTPAALVAGMIDAALAALVARRLGVGDGEAERRLAAGDPGALAIVADATVLDPAVGSGAFVLGALERLVALTGGGLPVAAAKRTVLARNLFGVDLSATAVRLAELRLWLSVVADDPADHPALVAPLPNLDCLVRQGDSLADLPGLALPGEIAPARARELRDLRRALVGAAGGEKTRLLRALRRAELDAFAVALAEGESRAAAAIADALARARAADLFGTRTGVSRDGAGEIRRLRRIRRELREARRRLRREGTLSWFHYQSQFADVFARGGFDLVVGNPPWVRAEELPAALRNRLAARYRWWRSAGGRGYAHRPDLAVAFLERSIELAAPDGVVALLVPAKLATAGYAASARHGLATTTTLHALADLTGAPAAEFDATVYPLALVASRGAPPPGRRVRVELRPGAPHAVPQADLVGGAPWVLLPDALRGALAAVRAAHPLVRDGFAIHLGLKTGANSAFLDPPDDLEPELIRWAVRGRDVLAFAVRPRRRLLWTHDAAGAPLPSLPPKARAHVARFAARLGARADYAGGPLWTLFRAGPASARHRVVWPDLARELVAAPLTGPSGRDRIPLNTCYVALASDAERALRLAAWLNSTWIRAAARAAAVPAASGFARFTAATVGELPCPPAALTDPDLLALARSGAAGEPVQPDLDDVAAGILDLGPAERRTLAAMGRTAGDRR